MVSTSNKWSKIRIYLAYIDPDVTQRLNRTFAILKHFLDKIVDQP